MSSRTIKIEHGNAIVLVLHVAKEQEKTVKDFFRTTLERLEKIMTVPASVVQGELRKKNPMIGTPAGALKAYRLREGLSQAELAKKAGLKQHHISEMEKRKRGIGSKSAKALAKVLNCKLEQLLS
ncbi:MAG: helix-turn-helix transcriptional regulator [Deltaproteobacteria bacterium]|nr:helix-turn-helix transcriptional regulator [Deltaproteobacteria bacterium]